MEGSEYPFTASSHIETIAFHLSDSQLAILLLLNVLMIHLTFLTLKFFRPQLKYYLAISICLLPLLGWTSNWDQWVATNHKELGFSKDPQSDFDTHFSYPFFLLNPECEKQDKLLSRDQKIALLAYTMEGYKPLNTALRQDVIWRLNDLQKFNDLVSESLNRLPKKAGWVYRFANLPVEVIARYKPDTFVKEKAFTSSTRGSIKDLTLKLAESNVVFKIGTFRGTDIHCFSKLPEESEWLFDKGSEFYVKTVNTNRDGKTFITLEHQTDNKADFQTLSEPKVINLISATYQIDDRRKQIVDITKKMKAECDGRLACIFEVVISKEIDYRKTVNASWTCPGDPQVFTSESSGLDGRQMISASCKEANQD